ncbi:sugar transferase [Aquirhabdus sp.]|uniref:sugar transferase n=1 Tax=Aquirhabdus sp. TaxID=2824160 RepID=UPI00396C4BC9
MYYQAIKRVFDVTVAFVLTIALLPVALVVALLIKFESPGPVFFRQARTGRFEKPFYIIKFRTMRHDTQGLNITASSDHRITGVGRVLRKTKLDEIPQLLNVLKGDMSIVGPRPEVVSHLPHYDDEAKVIIFAHRPGMTDLASLLYMQEERLLAESSDPLKTYFEIILPEKNRLRVRHLVQQSFIFDMKVFVWTGLKILLRHHMPLISCPSDMSKMNSIRVIMHEHSSIKNDVV